jgi:prepilin-type N-terminal cleavage/methylation domain-containing protein
MSIKKHSYRRTRHQRGFTLVETLIAMAIMAIGLLGAAALMSQMSISSNDSRYMSVEALLASEKLEDLNHYPNGDPNVTVPAGTIVGDLTADAAPLTIAGRQVAYSDTVQISSGAGSIEEVTSGTNAGGVATYTSITHKPDGTVVSVTTPSTTAPTKTPDMLLFKRRWTIEKDQPVANVLRMTVRVLLINGTRNQTTTFQSSIVRPAPQP